MGDYSSFYKYEKFEVVGDELISLGIFSVDADGTMPLVVKDDCDPQCGCPQPIYQWIQTEDTVCIEVITRTTTGTPYCSGDDLYADVTVEESIDDGDTWEVVSTTPTLVEEGGCASPEVQYKWVAIGTTCSNGNKYQNNVKQVSTDGGHTWTDVVPAEYSASTLIESDSYDCGYRTRTTTGESYCNNANEYAYTYNEVSRDYGNTWTTASTSSVLVQSDSYDCGYRTGTTSSSTYCNGDDLYVDVYYRVSRDTGTTWTTASTTPTLVEAGGCASPTGGKFTLTLSDSSTVTAACDSTSAITSGEVASQYSGSVVSAVIGDCVTNIDRGTFMNCSGLTSVTIPNNVVTIGNIAFSRCYGLTNITIPSGVTVIGYQTFYVCTGLTSVEIPSGVTEIGISAFDICSSLTSVTIPNSVTTINGNAFKDCHSLANLNIGSNVTTIGSSAFYWCNSLTSVTIPNGVTTIGMQAFSRCSGLQSITCLATRAPSLGSSAFDNTNDCPIYVPSGSVNDYKAVWSKYSSRIQAIPNS